MLNEYLLLTLNWPLVEESHLGAIVLLYIGPDAVLPIASFCAGLIGFVLIFWRYILGLGRRLYNRLNQTVTKQDEAILEPEKQAAENRSENPL